MASSVPAAVTGLLSQISAHVDLTGVPVNFGPPMTDLGAKERVSVGYDPTGGLAIDDTSEWAQLGAQKHEDRYEITCALVAWGGSPTEDELLRLLTRAHTMLSAVISAIATDYTLGGAVRIAHVLSNTTAAEQTDDGPAVTVTFRVGCEVRTTA